MVYYLFLCSLLLSLAKAASNEFTYTGTPEPGKPFTITWNPATYDKVYILLNRLTGFPYYLPTTNTAIADSIPNSGSYIWDVPTDLQGYFSLAIARDYQFSVSFSPKFTLGPFTFSTIQPITSIPQSTGCTSAIPVPTGFSPFIVPDRSSDFRVGFPTTITWQPTSKNNVTLVLNPRASDELTIAPATIITNITNTGSFTWTPPDDPTLLSSYGWHLTLFDDVTAESSESESFNIFSPTAMNRWAGPYIPPVMGQDHTFNWSPDKNKTVSILLRLNVPRSTVNVTIADHVPNTGSFVWSVPKTDPVLVPGLWWFDLIEDTSGETQSSLELAVNAEPASVCLPGTSDALSSFLATHGHGNSTSTTSSYRAANTTTAASVLSIMSYLSSLESARTATITRSTPHVLTTLDPTSSAGSPTVLAAGVTGTGTEKVTVSRSTAAAATGMEVKITGIGLGGLLLGVLRLL